MRLASITSYGLDVQAGQPILVRWRSGRAEPVPAAEVQASIARDVAGGNAVLAMGVGAHESVLRRVTAPIASRDKARRVLPSLLDVELPFPLERCACDFPELRATPEGQTDALAVAVRQDELQATLQRGAACVAEPTHLDHEALAAWDQARIECPDLGAGLQAVLLLAADHLACILSRGDRLFAAQAVRIAPGADPAPAAARLAPLLRALLDQESDAPFPWFLAGPGAADRAAVAQVQAALRRPAGTPFHTAREPALFLARALARRAAGRCALACNLREGAWAHPAVAALRAKSAARAQFATLAAGLLLLAGSLAWTGWLNGRTEDLRAQLNREAVTLTGLSRVPRGQEVELARRALKDRGAKPDPFVAAVRDSSLDLIARLAAESTSAHATISRLQLEGSAFELTLRSADAGAGDKLVAALAGQGCNTELKTGSAGADGLTPFVLKGAL